MQPKKASGERKPFAVINNVRDHCDLPDSLKLLLMILATYCDDEAICFPGNRKLADAMQWKCAKTVTRTLKKLVAAGELEILATGRGRGAKRLVRLTKYAPDKWDTGRAGLSRLNGTPRGGETSGNCHKEQPPRFSPCSKRTRATSANAPARVRFIQGFDDLSSDQKEIVVFYNRIMPPLGWLEVTLISKELLEALPMRSADEWRDLWSELAAEKHRRSWPAGSLTFVRGHWHNR